MIDLTTRTSTIPGVDAYEVPMPVVPALTAGERVLVDAVRRIRRTGRPGMVVVYVDARSVSLRVCGPPERVTE